MKHVRLFGPPGNRPLHRPVCSTVFHHDNSLFLKAASTVRVKGTGEGQHRFRLVAAAYKQRRLRRAIEAIVREEDQFTDEIIARRHHGSRRMSDPRSCVTVENSLPC